MHENIGVIKTIAALYIIAAVVLIGVLIVVSFSGWDLEVGEFFEVDPVLGLGWFPALVIVASLGMMSRKRWGRYMGYLVSIPIIFIFPFGTFLAAVLIWRLTTQRATYQF